jgi:molybdopterin-guanine dinucleotide biosynthesis protein A
VGHTRNGADVPLAAVVLAGGASRRMGRDKATLTAPGLDGTTLVERTVAVLRQRCAPVLVIAAPGQSLPDLPAAVVLRDEARGIGPLLATGRGLRAAAAAGLERAYVSAVDMPGLSVALIDLLAGYDGVDVVLPWDGRDHYLAGVYRTGLAARIDDRVAAGQRSMRALADAVVTQRVVLADDTPVRSALANLNTEADLRN